MHFGTAYVVDGYGTIAEAGQKNAAFDPVVYPVSTDSWVGFDVAQEHPRTATNVHQVARSADLVAMAAPPLGLTDPARSLIGRHAFSLITDPESEQLARLGHRERVAVVERHLVHLRVVLGAEPKRPGVAAVRRALANAPELDLNSLLEH